MTRVTFQTSLSRGDLTETQSPRGFGDRLQDRTPLIDSSRPKFVRPVHATLLMAPIHRNDGAAGAPKARANALFRAVSEPGYGNYLQEL